MSVCGIACVSVLSLICFNLLQRGSRDRSSLRSNWRVPRLAALAAGFASLLFVSQSALAAEPEAAAGEANLKLPDLSAVNFLGVDGHKLLLLGILFCIFGLAFGMVIY